MAGGSRPLLGALLVCAATTASGAPIFTASPEGDWFDGASWSTGVAPTASDAPVIDNGGTAVASSESPLYPGAGNAVEVGSLSVGSWLDTSQGLDASGALHLDDVDLHVGGDLLIGVALSGPAPPNAVGSLIALGGTQTAGNVIVGGATGVGSASALCEPQPMDFELCSSRGTGAFSIGGDLETHRALGIGTGLGFGEALIGGEVRMIPDLPPNTNIAFAEVAVGTLGLFGTDTPAETPTGSLRVEGDLRVVYDGERDLATELRVGVAEGAARGDGFLEIGGDALGFRVVQVGVAANGSGGVEAVATGELRVAGTLGAVDPVLGIPNAPIEVGVARALTGGGVASAAGRATVGEISGQSMRIGIAANGPAIGVVEIGTGKAGDVEVGLTGTNADAEGTLTTGGDIGFAIVGRSVGGLPPFGPYTTGDAVGSVRAAGIAAGAQVGWVVSDGTATGYLEVEGILGAAPAPVMVGFSSEGAGTANGHVVVRSGGIDTRGRIAVGALQGQAPSRLAAGTVTGLLESTGNVLGGFSQLARNVNVVGYADALATGVADGTWILHEGTFTGGRLIVGLSEGPGTATGRLHLDRALVDVLDLTLGDGATIELEMQGALRGAEYSAIDADVAKLNGVLAVSFLGPAALGVYDLIRSNGIDGITGVFDAVTIAGLAADQQAFWGVEVVGNANPIEMFRLYVVPEPATGALLALGLLGISAPRTRAGRRAVR